MMVDKIPTGMKQLSLFTALLNDFFIDTMTNLNFINAKIRKISDLIKQ